MQLSEIYAEFISVAKSQYTPEKYKEYKKLAAKVFSLLKKEYNTSQQKVKEIEDIYHSLEEEEKDPIAFWGSEKIAKRNHYVYVADKEGRLFEKLRIWYERR